MSGPIIEDWADMHEPFELLYKHCLFKVTPRDAWNGGVTGRVAFLRYEGLLQIEKSTREAIEEEIKGACEMYRRTETNYAELTLADFLAKMLPDV